MDPFQIALLALIVVGHGLLIFRDIKDARDASVKVKTLYEAIDLAIETAVKYDYDGVAACLFALSDELDRGNMLNAAEAMAAAAAVCPGPFKGYLEDIVGKRFRDYLERRSAFLEDW